MSARRLASVALAVLLTPAPVAAGEGLQATRTLVARLAAAGRGEADVTLTASDPMGGPDQVQRGRLALEPPDRARLDFPASGERLTVRSDGGEWVQPSARQLVRLSAEQAGLAAWLWEAFLKGGSSTFAEKASGTRRYVLEPRAGEEGLPERVILELDGRGLPAAIGFEESGGGWFRYRFTSWRFVAARGAAAFTLAPPKGYTVISLP